MTLNWTNILADSMNKVCVKRKRKGVGIGKAMQHRGISKSYLGRLDFLSIVGAYGINNVKENCLFIMQKLNPALAD